MSGTVYLDVNATAPVPPEVRAAVLDALLLTGNPSAVHQAGRAARRLVEDARETIAAALGAAPADVVFTSGGTEANALALQGFASAADRIAVSAIEHPSVLAAARATGLPIDEIGVDTDGVLDLAALDRALSRAGQTLVAVMAANNETGVVQPIAEVARRAKAAGALVHVDAVQALGRMSVSFADLDIESLSVSAHKLGGPKGVGALVVRGTAPLRALWGGGQERGRRAGTENVPGIAGFAAAVNIAQARAGELHRVGALRDNLECKALARVPDAFVFGANVSRLANTSALALPGVASDLQVMTLDLAGICVSAGSACSSGKVTRSHVLAAMGAGALAGETIRVSLGLDTDEHDIARFLDVWTALAARRAELSRISA